MTRTHNLGNGCGTNVAISFEVPDTAEHYLESSARLRGVSRSQLIRRTMELIVSEQLFLSILDDGDKPSDKTASRQGRRPRKDVPPPKDGRAGRAMPPRDRLFDALNRVASVPITRPMTALPARKVSPTKTEMQRDLQQAVLNTGGELLPTTGES